MPAARVSSFSARGEAPTGSAGCEDVFKLLIDQHYKYLKYPTKKFEKESAAAGAGRLAKSDASLVLHQCHASSVNRSGRRPLACPREASSHGGPDCFSATVDRVSKRTPSGRIGSGRCGGGDAVASLPLLASAALRYVRVPVRVRAAECAEVNQRLPIALLTVDGCAHSKDVAPSDEPDEG